MDVILHRGICKDMDIANYPVFLVELLAQYILTVPFSAFWMNSSTSFCATLTYTEGKSSLPQVPMPPCRVKQEKALLKDLRIRQISLVNVENEKIFQSNFVP